MKNTFKKLLLTSSIIVLMHSTYSFANNSANAYRKNDGMVNAQHSEAEDALNNAQEFLKKNLFNRNLLPKAIKKFDLAIQINPDNCRAYLGKANAYRMLADYKDVVKSVQDASSCESCKTTDIAYYMNSALSIGQGLYYVKKYTDAIEVYNLALNVQPDNRDILNAKNKAEQAKGSK